MSSKRTKYTGVCIENCDHMIMTCPGWKVLNALYTPSRAYRLLGSISPWPRVICIRKVTWFPSLHMWLTLGAKHSIFLKSVKNRGVFVTFMQDSSWMLVLYCDLPAFAVEIVLALLALDNELFESSTLTGQFSNSWRVNFQKYRAYSAFDTLFPSLFPSLLFTLDINKCHSWIDATQNWAMKWIVAVASDWVNTVCTDHDSTIIPNYTKNSPWSTYVL